METSRPTGNRSTNKANTETRNISALLELREFIAAELDVVEGLEGSDRTFRPLTDGLGLESPAPRKDPIVPKFTRQHEPTAAPHLSPSSPKNSWEERNQNRVSQVTNAPVSVEIPNWIPAAAEKKAAAQALAQVIDPAVPVVATPVLVPEPAVPPALPKVSFGRRFMAGLVDLIFVWTLVALAIGVTLKFLPTGAEGLTLATLKNVQGPLLIRLAILEFSTIWLCFLAFGYGLTEMTFGMWVWGMRVRYGDDESRTAKKFLRILFSFVFFGMVIPLPLLLLSRRGKNLLDYLSGTSVYRTT